MDGASNPDTAESFDLVRAAISWEGPADLLTEVAESLARKILAECVNAHQVDAFTTSLVAMNQRNETHADFRVTDVSV